MKVSIKLMLMLVLFSLVSCGGGGGGSGTEGRSSEKPLILSINGEEVNGDYSAIGGDVLDLNVSFGHEADFVWSVDSAFGVSLESDNLPYSRLNLPTPNEEITLTLTLEVVSDRFSGGAESVSVDILIIPNPDHSISNEFVAAARALGLDDEEILLLCRAPQNNAPHGDYCTNGLSVTCGVEANAVVKIVDPQRHCFDDRTSSRAYVVSDFNGEYELNLNNRSLSIVVEKTYEVVEDGWQYVNHAPPTENSGYGTLRNEPDIHVSIENDRKKIVVTSLYSVSNELVTGQNLFVASYENPRGAMMLGSLFFENTSLMLFVEESAYFESPFFWWSNDFGERIRVFSGLWE